MFAKTVVQAVGLAVLLLDLLDRHPAGLMRCCLTLTAIGHRLPEMHRRPLPSSCRSPSPTDRENLELLSPAYVVP